MTWEGRLFNRGLYNRCYWRIKSGGVSLTCNKKRRLASLCRANIVQNICTCKRDNQWSRDMDTNYSLYSLPRVSFVCTIVSGIYQMSNCYLVDSISVRGL